MAHPHEETLRRWYDAHTGRDMEKVGEVFAEDVVWHFAGRGPFAGDHRGRDELFAIFEGLHDRCDSVDLEVHDVLANDQHGVALLEITKRREGKEVTSKIVHVFNFDGGKIVEMWDHPFDVYQEDELLASAT